MLSLFLIFISIFWFIVYIKKLLFWVYLWQLKEYHIGRFLDHFHTYKGKRLVLNGLLSLKFAILLGIFFSAEFSAKLRLNGIKSDLIYLTAAVFIIEAVFFLKNVRQGMFKKPVLTRKIAVILSSGFSLGVLILFVLFVLELSRTKFVFSLLFFDVFAPIFFSALILAYQPLAVFLRGRLIKAAKVKRAGLKNLIVVGVAGSYGKTSTKEYLAAILSEKFRVLKTKEHQNSEVGISECILDELNDRHEIFVVEMGAYNRGGIKLLCDIVLPKIGVLTGINEQHMATFGSQENIVKAKYELIESLPIDGTAFFNANNEYCRELYQKTLRRGASTELSRMSSGQAMLYGEGANSAYEENLAGARAVAEFLGLNQEEIERGVKKIESQASGRIKKGVNGINVIDATYSANPSGVIADLDYLGKQSGKKVLVMPCLIELGKASKEVHLRIGKKIGEVCDLVIITTKDRFKAIKEAAEMIEASPQSNKAEVLFLENPEKIIKKIKSFCKEGDVVLLESRVPQEVITILID